MRKYSLIAILIVFTAGMLLCFDRTAAAANEVTSPSEGQILFAGSRVDIKWTLEPNWTITNISYSSDNRVHWNSIIESASGSRYTWTVPNLSSEDCWIRLSIDYTSGTYSTNRYIYSEKFTIQPPISIIPTPLTIFIAAPVNLQVDSAGSDFVQLSWDDKTTFEDGFKLERKTADGGYAVIKTLPSNTESYTDNTVNAGTNYTYRVRAYDGSNYSSYSNTVSVNTADAANPVGPTDPVPVEPGPAPAEPGSNAIEMIFYLGSTEYYVNGQLKTMDTAPIALEGRTVLPIRYVADALRAQVTWNEADSRVTVTGTKTIELTIGNPWARVNGALTFIDPNNEKVIPVVLPPGRTMLPLRFTAETLGCSVQWNPTVQEVRLLYPAS